jgi:hypothetical protein
MTRPTGPRVKIRKNETFGLYFPGLAGYADNFPWAWMCPKCLVGGREAAQAPALREADRHLTKHHRCRCGRPRE